MKFYYKGKYKDEPPLPQREHPKGYVPYKEPQNMKKFALAAHGIALLLFILLLWLSYLRTGKDYWLNIGLQKFWWGYAGVIASLLTMVPHEFLHAICFKDEVWMFQNLKQGLLFVVGTEDMTKARFIFMSMLPNLVFGLIPYLAFMLNPNWIFCGVWGVASLSAGVGDYINVFNTIVQVPKGGLVYMSGMHSYWYIPQN